MGGSKKPCIQRLVKQQPQKKTHLNCDKNWLNKHGFERFIRCVKEESKEGIELEQSNITYI
jgi:phage host-nuclease inhibitor protein Gam